MSTTWTMWLGIAFLFLAIIAVILQAWLWGFPMEPPGDPEGKSTAPRGWINIHRLVGASYVVIYIIMMSVMIPRLWEYQFELPARTVIHAVAGITIGVLLVAKISIIRFFQHFGGGLPGIGLGLLICTVILAMLSLPYAMRAHGMGARTMEPENIARVSKALSKVTFDEKVPLEALVSEGSLLLGRDLLARKCTICHDLRTVLKKPRTAQGWHDITLRMAEKPSFSTTIESTEVPYIAAYLVAITPNLQRSLRKKKAREREQKNILSDLATPTAEPSGEKTQPVYDEAKTKELFEDKCTECHEVDEIDGHGKDSKEGWAEVVHRMIDENGAELEVVEARMLIDYLAKTRGN